MNFTIYLPNDSGSSVWLSEDNQIRVFPPTTVPWTLSPPQWEIRIGTGTKSPVKFDTMGEVLTFLNGYCDSVVSFTIEEINNADFPEVRKSAMRAKRWDKPEKTVPPPTDISKRKLLLK